MNAAPPTDSPINPISWPHQFSEVSNSSPGGTHGISTEERPRVACNNCSRRKVKCDRERPACGLCAKQLQPCVYSAVRKRPVRRQRYGELTKRLEDMERVLVGFKPMDQNTGISPRPSFASPPLFPPMDTQTAPLTQIMNPCSPIEESGFEWEIPESGLLESSEVDSMSLDPRPPFEPGYATSAAGSYPIFSPRGVQWVNTLLGDNRFSTAMNDIRNKGNKFSQTLDPSTSLLFTPSHSLIEDCVKGYLSTFNRDTPLFQDEGILAALNQYRAGTQCSKAGHMAAFNIIVAHANFNCYCSRFRVDSDNHLRNALAAIPSIVFEGPDMISIGALLCIVQYLVCSAEYKPAVAILGLAVQMLILANYHRADQDRDLDTMDVLHQQRLFWHAYIMDNDLALRLGKAPIITEPILISLPTKSPIDGHGYLEFEDGSMLNFIRERVALAKIQSKIYSMLSCDNILKLYSPQQLYDNMIELDQELQAWKSGIPELVRPQRHLNDRGVARMTCLTALHSTYFQLVIAIHSTIFVCLSEQGPEERKKTAMPSVALCVSAARASISLLNYHNYSQPFTIWLLHHVAWSLDILFINIIQTSPSTRKDEDIALLEMVVKFFEKHDPKHVDSMPYRIINALYLIALEQFQRTHPDTRITTQAGILARSAAQFPPNSTPEISMNDDSLPLGQKAGGAPSALSATSEIGDSFESPVGTRQFYNPPPAGLDWTIPLDLEDRYWQEQNSFVDTAET